MKIYIYKLKTREAENINEKIIIKSREGDTINVDKYKESEKKLKEKI